MVQLPIDIKTFLTDFWQKKPLVIRNALPNFNHFLTADELAGLSLEEDIESRLVLETPKIAPFWELRTGPFELCDFKKLPKTHWTLLVQGVDKLIPEIGNLFDYFNFIPQWRIDDIMISYAVKQGSVGPHYDNYDVFLYQSSGRRRWSLTTQDCHPSNYLKDVPLRIMERFVVEEDYILEPGDMLYLPPHVGHHGVSLTDDCMTYSFGYRSYQRQELWDNFGDYLAERGTLTALYTDPNWTNNTSTAVIPPQAWINAKQLMQQCLDDEQLLKEWFGCFVTAIDSQSEQLLPLPSNGEEVVALPLFIEQLISSQGLIRNTCCRFAYHESPTLQLFINGSAWPISQISPGLVEYVANHRVLQYNYLLPFLNNSEDQLFLYELFKLQWLEILQ